ncbi:MAG: carbamoyltransferase HypF [Thermoplasmata archaeon]
MRIVLRGTVQGVGFRPTVYRVAEKLGLKGHVKNLGNEVEVVIDGDPEIFLKELRKELPPLAEISEVDIEEKGVKTDTFKIVKSSDGEKRSSTIPVDTALCPECLEELKNPDDRRSGFPFINCTNCGARYSTIRGLPYDRAKTTMKDFPLCEECVEEYKAPSDRRFHAQTISCKKCGPRYVLFDKEKNKIGGIDEFCALLEQGKICVAKSWGGMHIICTLEEIPALRNRYGRKEKPFALMMRDLETVKKYAEVEREDVLTGPRRPIMVYTKKDMDSRSMEYAAPGLPTVGIMLPYTGLHHLLFDKIDRDALVMTSANPPGEPMIIENDEAFKLDFDCFLLHNRKIANRIDDSLIRVHGDSLSIIRRARGFVPDYFMFGDKQVMASGADQSGCLALSKDGKLYPSQYLGDLRSYNAKKFYEDTHEYLTSILGIDEIGRVAVDLHPSYQSRRLGLDYAEQYDSDVIEIQHHWAHGASLLLEHDLNDMICIAVDGTGYGEDGQSWGGEILYCSVDEYERVGHLETFPLLGGEKAVEEPERLVYAIERSRGIESDRFEPNERDILDKLMKNSISTSSFGRLLDAVSCALDISCERTYQGEPAMKLEKYQMLGKEDIDFDVDISGDTIHTLDGFIQMLESDEKMEDRAASYVARVAEKIAERAVGCAEEKGTQNIGISGGVSYNRPIVRIIRERLNELDYKLVVHNGVPNGDMGVPIGQAHIAANIH